MKRRHGFTIVELLVAMALVIFIMAILSQAFVYAMTTFRNLKAVGDMAQKLRATTQILQRDLGAYHFEGSKRLSDPTFWSNGPPQQGFFQITHGSPSYWQGNPYPSFPVNPPYPPPPTPPAPLRNYIEATPGFGDPSNINSYLSTDHALAFTVKLFGNNMGNFMSAGPAGGGSGLSGISTFGPQESRYQLTSGAGAYNYQWAEIAWFMQPSGDITNVDRVTASPAFPLYTLYRRQRLLVPDNNLVTQAYPPNGLANSQAANYLEISCWPNTNSGYLYFNSPSDITVPTRRFGSGLAQNFTTFNGTPLAGSDIQLNDVVSFDVRLLTTAPLFVPPNPDPFVTLWQWPFFTLNVPPPPPNPPPTPWPPPPGPGINNGNALFYPNNPNGPMVFDTWSSLNDGLSNYSTWNSYGSIPLWLGTGPIIQAVQISIRIWDYKTNQTRQVTIVQAM